LPAPRQPQEEQEPEVHPEHEGPDDAREPPFSLEPAIPKVDIFLSGFAHLHFGHATFVVE
jgi:hypothetical protein